MKSLQVVIFYCALVVSVYSEESGQRITLYDPTKYPFYAMFLVRTRLSSTLFHTKTCGGSLIHPQWILTAGHCLPLEESEFEYFMRRPVNVIFMGSVTRPTKKRHGQGRRIIEIHRHPDYVYKPDVNNTGYVLEIKNNIAVLKVDKPFRIQQTVDVIQLSTSFNKCESGIAIGIAHFNWPEFAEENPIVSYVKLNLKEGSPNKNSILYGGSGEVEPEKYNFSDYDFFTDIGGPVICEDSSLQIGVISADIENTENLTLNAIEKVDYYIEFIKKYVPIDSNPEFWHKHRRWKKANGSKLTSMVLYPYLLFILYKWIV